MAPWSTNRPRQASGLRGALPCATWLWVGACSGASLQPLPSPERNRPAAVEASPALHRLRADAAMSLVSPEPSPPEPGGDLTLSVHAWASAGDLADGRHRWVASLPFAPSSTAAVRPGDAPADGARLMIDGQPAAWGIEQTPLGWSHDDHRLYLSSATRPEGRAEIVLPAATVEVRTASPSSQTSALGQRRTIDGHTWTGLELPGGAVVSFEVAVPPAGELSLAAAHLPRIDGGAGARLRLSIDDAPIGAWPVDVGPPQPRLVDLSSWAGNDVKLTLAADAPIGDQVFVGAPEVATRSTSSRRVVWVVVDSLRADRMTQAGYPRATTDALSGLADAAVRFTDARTTTPATTYSLRALVSGMRPHRWPEVEPLAVSLAARGWHTAAFLATADAGVSTGLDRGFTEHHVDPTRVAASTTDQALDWLDRHDAHDAFVVVHYGDLSPPWAEPSPYRTRYASELPPAGLPERPVRSDIEAATANLPPSGKEWLSDRYDGSLQYVAEEVARLIAGLDSDDIVVLTSPHGAELFDHNTFGDGHTLFEEQLRVPLWLRATGLAPATVSGPVTLLDVVPTMRELLGLPALPSDGLSLRAVADHTPAAREALMNRDLALGHTQSSSPWWGLISGDTKWISREGREQLYHLTSDPDETQPLLTGDMAPADAYRARFPDALDLDVVQGWMFKLVPGKVDGPVHEALCSVRGGFARWAVVGDPGGEEQVEVSRPSSEAARALLDRWDADAHPVRDVDGHLLLRFSGPGPMVVVDTELPMDEVGYDARCTPRWCVKGPDATRDCPLGTLTIPRRREAHYGREIRFPLVRINWHGGREFIWGKAMTPLGKPVEVGDPLGRAGGGATGYSDDQLEDDL